MAAPLQGSEESVGELVARDGTDSPQIELKGGSPHSKPVNATETDELKDDDGTSSVSSAKLNILDVCSDVDDDFDPDLPTEYKPTI